MKTFEEQLATSILEATKPEDFDQETVEFVKTMKKITPLMVNRTFSNKSNTTQDPNTKVRKDHCTKDEKSEAATELNTSKVENKNTPDETVLLPHVQLQRCKVSLSKSERLPFKSSLKINHKHRQCKSVIIPPPDYIPPPSHAFKLQEVDGIPVQHSLPMRLPRTKDVDLHKNLYYGPTEESNWVIPGSLLVGAYPSANSDLLNLKIISSILEMGVTTFVCLQDEYVHTGVTPEMWSKGNYLRPYIYDALSLCKLQERRRKSNKPIYNRKFVDPDNLKFMHLPIPDCQCTTDRAVWKLARDLCWKLIQGEVLYLHCWGGHGRTGTVVAVMLGFLYGISANKALEHTQTYHDIRKANLVVRSPQTESQRAQVRRILKKWHNLKEKPLLSDTTIVLPYESADISEFALPISKQQSQYFQEVRKQVHEQKMERDAMASNGNIQSVDPSKAEAIRNVSNAYLPKKPKRKNISATLFHKARRLVPQKRSPDKECYTSGKSMRGWVLRTPITKTSSDSVSTTSVSDDSMIDMEAIETAAPNEHEFAIRRPIKPPVHSPHPETMIQAKA